MKEVMSDDVQLLSLGDLFEGTSRHGVLQLSHVVG